MRKPSEQLTIHSANKGWHRVETPDGDEFVSTVYVAGVVLELGSGNVALEVEEDEWVIEGAYDPCLLIEAPKWYTPMKDDECPECGEEMDGIYSATSTEPDKLVCPFCGEEKDE